MWRLAGGKGTRREPSGGRVAVGRRPVGPSDGPGMAVKGLSSGEEGVAVRRVPPQQRRLRRVRRRRNGGIASIVGRSVRCRRRCRRRMRPREGVRRPFHRGRCCARDAKAGRGESDGGMGRAPAACLWPAQHRAQAGRAASRWQPVGRRTRQARVRATRRSAREDRQRGVLFPSHP
jgi:hypothetical protein